MAVNRMEIQARALVLDGISASPPDHRNYREPVPGDLDSRLRLHALTPGRMARQMHVGWAGMTARCGGAKAAICSFAGHGPRRDAYRP